MNPLRLWAKVKIHLHSFTEIFISIPITATASPQRNERKRLKKAFNGITKLLIVLLCFHDRTCTIYKQLSRKPCSRLLELKLHFFPVTIQFVSVSTLFSYFRFLNPEKHFLYLKQISFKLIHPSKCPFFMKFRVSWIKIWYRYTMYHSIWFITFF